MVLLEDGDKHMSVRVDHISIESGGYGVAVLVDDRGRTFTLMPGEVMAMPGDVEVMLGSIKISSDRNRTANGTARLLFNAPRNVRITREEIEK